MRIIIVMLNYLRTQKMLGHPINASKANMDHIPLNISRQMVSVTIGALLVVALIPTSNEACVIPPGDPGQATQES